MWYPSVRRTLLCLSKLNRSLDKAIFQGLSQEALSACIANLSVAAGGIATRKTLVDGQLFEIKHLLILREQIAPFQVDFSVRETTLDFSRVKIAGRTLNQNQSLLALFLFHESWVCEMILICKRAPIGWNFSIEFTSKEEATL